MSKITLHIATCDKFIPPFIELVKEHFEFNKHQFLLNNGMSVNELKNDENVTLAKKSIIGQFKYYVQAIIKMSKAKKIILHGLFDSKLVYLLFFMPWLLKKCYWIMWGGDLYVFKFGKRTWKWKLYEFFRRPVLKNMGFLVNGTSGDVTLAREWYKAKGKHIKCFNYPSNLFKEFQVPLKQDTCTHIMVGNSADPSNNHIEIFHKLKMFKEQNIKIYTPLTYGDKHYIQSIIEYGNKCFGDKFEALTDHAPLNSYIEFLGKIDIAIFNHERQQAFGNIITLLGYGKKVYLNPKSTLVDVFKEFGIEIFLVSDINIDLINEDTANRNIQKVKAEFSKQSLVDSLAKYIQ